MKQKRQQQNPEQKITTLEKELALKSRELKIETALEKVRNKALRMKKPDDMLDVCKTISLQLESLGVNEIRNIQTAIFYPQRGTYMNYEYYAKHNKTIITETSYTNHKMHKAFARKMLKGKGEFFVTHIKGKKVKDWIAYQKTTNVFIDKYLKTTSSLSYYWFSLGPVALGISTYHPLNEEEIILFKRFLKVFELAYRRYLDIEKAEAHAREAQIEASLERVRAVAMSMHKSADLLNVCEIMYGELYKLGFYEMRNAMINIHNDENKTFLNYDYSDEIGKSVTLLDYNAHPVMEKQIKQSRMANNAFSEAVYKGKDLKAWKEFRRKYGEKDDPRIKKITALYYYFYSIGNGTIGVSTFGPINEEKLALIKRFRNVFNLAYKRYTDISLAEAQARENQIELALERIRARTMAMHKSDELSETAFVLFEQFRELGENPEQLSIGTVNEAESTLELWVTVRGNKFDRMFKVPIDEQIVINKIYNAWKEKNKSFILDISGAELKNYNSFRNRIPDFKDYNEIKNRDKQEEQRRVIHCAFFTKGLLSLATPEPRSDETIKLLERFAGVFELTYTRFLDLQKAEEQAREAQIETALERVRASSMAMHKSNELLDVITVVSNQFENLGFRFDIVSFAANNQEFDYNFWLSIKGQSHPYLIYVPYIDNPMFERVKKAQLEGQPFYSDILTKEENKQWHQHLFKHNELDFLTDKLKKYVFNSGYARSIALLPNIMLIIGNYSSQPYSDEENNIIKRFANVFDQAYRRFLDLQMAEAQAREAQIEASLERVRAVAMGMNKPEDLLNICEESFREFKKLGFDNIRNAIIHIPNDKLRYFMDYDFSELTGGAITKIEFGSHPIVDEYLKKIRSAADAYFEVVINEDQLEGWKDFRNKSGQKDDPRLDEATALYYYLFSIGIGDIGISTFKQIDESQIKILKRFRNVFDLAYRRYTDITLAESQAREAKIEAALERVRSRSMAMHKSNELLEVINVVSEQLQQLNIKFGFVSFGFIGPDLDFDFWLASPGFPYPERIYAPYINNPIANTVIEAQKKGMNFFTDIFSKEDNNQWLQLLFEHNKKSFLFEKTKKFLLNTPGFARSAVILKHINIFIGNYIPKPYSDEENHIIIRFANVFEQSYTRFLDLQKAEEQAREAQIETALERVRAKAMAMHSSNDLTDTMGVLFTELPKLGINSLRCGVVLLSRDSQRGVFYAAATTPESDSFTMIGGGDMAEHSVFMNQYKSWLKNENYFTTLSNEELQSYYEALFARLSIPYKPREHKVQTEHGYYFAFSAGMFYAWAEDSYSEAQINILNRFKAIIDLTFRRYIDLQKAEAQAREAQIELALERVRAKAMAMHSSKDLADTLSVFYGELKLLGVTPRRCGVALMNKETKMAELTTMNTTEQGNSINVIGQIKMTGHPVLDQIFENWLIQKEYQTVLRGNQIKEYYQILKPQISYPDYPHDVVQYGYYFMFKEGDVYAWTEKELTEDELKIYRRFTTVISLTYKRYKDLQRAEAQAREAEIEAALERVRSRTMAMQKSDELAETASHLFAQLNSLGIKPYRFNIAIVDAESENCQLWSTTNEGKVISSGPLIPLTEHNIFNQMYEGWKQQQNILVIKLTGEARITWTKYIMRYVSFNEYKPENIDLERLRHEPAIFSNFSFKQGFIVVHTIQEINKTDLKIIQRFVNVFEQTFTRFLDLQKAEEQTREARIESSLERVRSRAMSMHSPDDLSETVSLFFNELKSLKVLPWRCGVGRIDEETRTTDLTTTSITKDGKITEVAGKLKQTGHPVLDGIFDHWKLQKEYYPVLRGDDINKYYSIIKPQIAYPDYPLDAVQYGHNIFFKEGFIFAWTENRLSEDELQIFRRFSSVLSLTYRRYMDLKEAEARATESVRQASLDRVRAEIASMRTADDLNRITPIIWRELKNLEVPFFRCGVYIIDEIQEKVQVYLTTPDGKSLGVLNLSFDSNEITNNTVEHWRKKQVFKTYWNKEEFTSWTKSMMNLGQIQSAETYQGSTTPPESLHLHFVPFTQGMLYVGDANSLTEEKLELVKTLAEAFSIAYARYEDFKNLEEAKNKVELTLSELKSAQAQLIHSEKMASLGELTAGIAHEIKNPLNFVNNFSEVSRELLDEMKAEIQNKNLEEVIGLIDDLKQNLEKINQHGKRADSIVKGMLLHSRGTSGEKTLTDINDLLDQYVNLAYHGMRAQNKEFNITIEKHYDESLEKINVVPQDISRVFLNIINNACYAANEKKQKRGNDFSPTLKVSTKKISGKVEIKIGDNGNGIPADHLDKIFQPFFTTKPSGEGTGLGLSLSYDIVTKVHGGELKVETKEGEGTEFLIILNN